MLVAPVERIARSLSTRNRELLLLCPASNTDWGVGGVREGAR